MVINETGSSGSSAYILLTLLYGIQSLMDERQMELMYNFSFSPAKYQISTPVLLTHFFFSECNSNEFRQ